MDVKELESLKLAAAKGKPLDPKTAIDLIEAYQGIVRAENFWGERAPKMVEELQVLRTMEPHLRALLAHGRVIAGALDGAAKALAEIDAMRAVGKVSP